ncbi:hypothetical protein O3P69_007448 [Scylla paramamosain]|uniref:Secreted protein n=1 Tax=Scylla paramamosain TaxID=85552 RepID=A0AAW0V5V8_SCYPA
MAGRSRSGLAAVVRIVLPAPRTGLTQRLAGSRWQTSTTVKGRSSSSSSLVCMPQDASYPQRPDRSRSEFQSNILVIGRVNGKTSSNASS